MSEGNKPVSATGAGFVAAQALTVPTIKEVPVVEKPDPKAEAFKAATAYLQMPERTQHEKILRNAAKLDGQYRRTQILKANGLLPQPL